MAFRGHWPVTRQRQLRPSAAAGAALFVAVLVGACSSGAGAKPIGAGATTSTAPASSSTTSTTTAAQATTAAILAGYRAQEAAFFEAAGQYPANPFDPGLAATMTGDELHAVESSLTIARHEGEYAVGTADLTPVVTGVTGKTATLSDCIFDHSRIVNGRTGRTVSGPDTERTLEHATLQLVDGVWKLASLVKVGAGCQPGDV